MYFVYTQKMELKVYNTEHFARSVRWYIVFIVVFAGMIIASVMYDNIAGAVLLFFLAGAYFYFSVRNSQPVMMRIESHSLMIANKSVRREKLQWFVIEADIRTGTIKNIVILTPNSHHIYTVDDTNEALETFVTQLDTMIPRMDNFKQSTVEKLARQLKL
jgi:predicted membrane protein